MTILLIILGFIFVIKGAEFLVDGSSDIARRFHIPQIIIGLTIVSIGTSLPELFISISSAIKGHTDLQIGNAIGSNLCNLLLILGASAIIKDLKLKRESRILEIPFSIIITCIVSVFCNTENRISKQEAIILLVLFMMFIIYTIIMRNVGEGFNQIEAEDKTEEKKFSFWKTTLFIILGIIGLKVGGDLIVDNAIEVAQYFNISQKVISLTILSIGTSLPELVTCIVAAKKGNSDISVGNIIGSNIFNITLIIGASSLINPISYNITYNIEIVMLLLANVFLIFFASISPKRTMTRKNGELFLVLFSLYIMILFKV